jgi:hypothetical protein
MLMINGWLVLDIALGIVVGDMLRIMLKHTREWWNSRRTNVGEVADEAAETDWQFLWDNAPASAKEEVRRLIEDDQLQMRARELNLWPHLWSDAPEEIKQKLRDRWKALNIPPRFIG